MSQRRKSNVVKLDSYRAIAASRAAEATPKGRSAIYRGAVWEFHQTVVPVLRELLDVKGVPEADQSTLIKLLEAIYGAHHVHTAKTRGMPQM